MKKLITINLLILLSDMSFGQNVRQARDLRGLVTSLGQKLKNITLTSEYNRNCRHETSNQCSEIGYVERIENDATPNLTTFWAQEYVGSDLVKEEIESYPPSNVLVVDSTVGNHGYRAGSLISTSDQKNVNDRISGSNSNIEYFQEMSVENYLEDNTVPRNTIISASIAFMTIDQNQTSEQILERTNKLNMSVSELVSQNITFVTSAGNKHNVLRPQDYSTFEHQSDQIITVGNIGPSGFIDRTSSSFENVTISAPAGEAITSLNHETHELDYFAGTSASTPTVAAALSNVKSVIPEINPHQLKKLLIKTAIPTSNILENPQTNGAGTLNSYKMFKVAQKIKAICESELNKSECIDRLLNNQDMYQFQRDDEVNLEVSHNFPDCGGRDDLVRTSNNEVTSCTKQEALKKLRKQALLRQNDSKLAEQLSCIYRELGYSDNSLHYTNIKNTIEAFNSNDLTELIYQAQENLLNNENVDIRQNSLRFLQQSSNNFYQFLERNISTPNVLHTTAKYFRGFRSTPVPAEIKNMFLNNLEKIAQTMPMISNTDERQLVINYIRATFSRLSHSDANIVFQYLKNNSVKNEVSDVLNRELELYNLENPNNENFEMINTYFESIGYVVRDISPKV